MTGDPETGLIRGYASLFGRTDLSGDRVERGAFEKTLQRRGAAGIRMLWQHDPAQPVGVWTRLVEDATGLFAEGRLALGTQKGREIFELIREGAVDGLSIGFRARRATREAGGAIRRISEIDLWEISVVTFPMQERARVSERRGWAASLAERFSQGARRLAARPAINPI